MTYNSKSLFLQLNKYTENKLLLKHLSPFFPTIIVLINLNKSKHQS